MPRARRQPPTIFLITGPSGVGQDSVINGIRKAIPCNQAITTVTRPCRQGERYGRPYYFITKKKFLSMLNKNEFVEHAFVYGYHYGITKAEIARLLRGRKPILWKIDRQGAATAKQLFPNSVIILIAAPSLTILRHRLIERGLDSTRVINRRLADIKTWLRQKSSYDYKIVNYEDRLADTIAQAVKIIKKAAK